MTHTTLGWLILGVSLVGLIASGATSQPVETIEPQEPQMPPEEIGAVDIESVDKPSDEPPSVTVKRAAACSDGSCGARRRGLLGILRGRR